MTTGSKCSATTGIAAWLVLTTITVLAGCGCGNSNAKADETRISSECVVGTYLVDQGSGTESIWTFFSGGNLIVTSSDQRVLNFSTQHGTWEMVGPEEIRATLVDFSFDDEGGLINIARVDIVVSLTDTGCDEIEGDFLIRFFEADEDPLIPSTDTGEPLSDTLVGRRVTVP
jgi:hypothetical protein